jgi:hypothetical protein
MQKIKWCFLLIACSSIHSSNAQDHARSYGVWGSFTSGKPDFVYVDTAIVRDKPDVGGRRLDTLYAGDTVAVVRAMTEELELKGIEAPWLEIRYRKRGTARKGFIWSGLLALKQMRLPDAAFLVGIDRVVGTRDVIRGEETYRWAHHFGVKAFRDGRMVDRNTTILNDIGYLDIEGGVVPAVPGLRNVKGRVGFTTRPEMSVMGAVTCEYLWTGDRLVPLPLQTNSSEAGAGYHKESLNLPGTKGVPDQTLVWTSEEGLETGKKDSKGKPVYKFTRREKKYTWDGERLTPVK